jgi:hypothetical protein
VHVVAGIRVLIGFKAGTGFTEDMRSRRRVHGRPISFGKPGFGAAREASSEPTPWFAKPCS